MPPDLALSSTLIGSNYPCLELIFMVPKVFEPMKFYCILWSKLKTRRKMQSQDLIKSNHKNTTDVENGKEFI